MLAVTCRTSRITRFTLGAADEVPLGITNSACFVAMKIVAVGADWSDASGALSGSWSETALASRITSLAEYSFDVKAVTDVADSTGEIRKEMVTSSARGALGRGCLARIAVAAACVAQGGALDEYFNDNRVNRGRICSSALPARVIRPEVLACGTGQAARRRGFVAGHTAGIAWGTVQLLRYSLRKVSRDGVAGTACEVRVKVVVQSSPASRALGGGRAAAG